MKIRSLLLIIILGTPLFMSAQDMCLQFDGQNDYGLMPFQDLTGKSEITLEAWINPDPNIPQYYQNIVRQNGQSIPAALLLAYQNNGTAISFGLNTTSGYVEIDPPVSPSQFTNVWSHIACVYDGDLMRMYINGMLVDSAVNAGTMNFSQPNTIFFGRRTISSPTEPYHGKLDEVRIWDVARTQQEIFNNMNCALFGPIPGLLAVYNLNSASGTVVVDNSGNGSSGTIYNSPQWITSPVAPVCSVGIDEQNDAGDISIYPNPVTQFFSIDIQIDGPVYLSVYDALGRLLIDRRSLTYGTNTFANDFRSDGIMNFVISNDKSMIESRMVLVQ